MRFAIRLMALAGLVHLTGCVSAPESGPQAGTAPIVLDEPELAVTAADDTPVSAEAAVTGDPSLDWQKTLTDDVKTVEAKGNAFLEASFKLYDQLLDEAKTTPERQQSISASVKESSDLYADLTGAVARLHADLNRPEIKEALPLKGDDGRREFDAVAELFSTYKLTARHEVAYDTANGPSITMLLFNDKEHGEGSGLDGLPKQQRDALLLLDYLRQVSNDMAYVSHAVTDWVDVRGTLGTEEEFAHH